MAAALAVVLLLSPSLPFSDDVGDNDDAAIVDATPPQHDRIPATDHPSHDLLCTFETPVLAAHLEYVSEVSTFTPARIADAFSGLVPGRSPPQFPS